MKRLLYGLAASALLLSPLRSPAGYLVTDLGYLGGADWQGMVTGINNSGQVVGYTTGQDNLTRAFLYSGGTMTTLNAPGGGPSWATGISSAGQVTGYFADQEGSSIFHAFVYGNGTMTDLGTGTRALGINNAGQVVGDLPGAGYRAFLYSGGKITDLGTLGGPESRATGINASGQVVGTSDNSPSDNGVTRAFLYSGGKMTDLGALPGARQGSGAAGINASGQVVGYSDTASGGFHAFLYSGGVMKDLGTLPGGREDYSSGTAINASGQAVGYSGTHAFLYSGGQMTDLNSLLPAGSGFTLSAAYGINDKGQIAAKGSDNHGYLLTPDVAATPEPGSLLLLALGGAGLLGHAWRKKRRRDRDLPKEMG
jgi:probable HAF family extracellular repeat protein